MVRPRGRPTPSEWEAIKPELEHLYLRQNWTLKAVSDFFAARGFVATVRQYKTKVNAWGFDVKKIKRPIWHSMYVVMRTRQEDGLSSAFIVPVRGHVRTVVRSDKILKETNRNKSVLDSSNFRRADAILRRADVIVCKDDDDEIRENLRAGPFTAASSSLQTDTYHADSNLLSGELQLSDDQTGNISSPSSDSSGLSPTMTNEESSHMFSAATPSTAGRRSHSFSTIESNLQRTTLSRTEDTEFTRVFDASMAINSLFSDPSCSDQTANNPQQSAQHEQEKELAMRWATPYLRAYYNRRTHAPNIDERGRQDAKVAFRSMLKSSNKYIFPYCHCMTTVLVSSCMTTLLTEFLSDCCEVIDQDGMGYELTYGSPLHLALALYANNSEDIEVHRHRFLASTSAIQLIWGKNSPNWLVNQNYYAWLLLEQGQRQEAVQMLKTCLPISEETMGRHHLITINCLAIMSRVLGDMGRETEAIALLQDILSRLTNCADILHAFRDRQVLRLAELQERAGNFNEAERFYRDTVNFRVENFGMLSETTNYTIRRLCNLLASQGRQQESNDWSQYYGRLEAEEREKERRQLQLTTLASPSQRSN